MFARPPIFICPLVSRLLKAVLMGFFAWQPGASMAAEIRYELSEPVGIEFVDSLLGERKEIASQQPANQPLAADLAFMLEELLREQGYPQAHVNGSVAETEIVLAVHAGTRVLLGDVRCLDHLQPHESRRLRDIFLAPSLSKRLALQRDIPWDAAAIERGRQAVIEDLQAQGYWKAQVQVRHPDAETPHGAIDVEVLIDRCALHWLTAPKWLKPPPPHLSGLVAKLQNASAEPATSQRINQLRRTIREHCEQNGFTDIDLRLSPLLGETTFTPQITLDLGPPYTLRQIRISGSNPRTRDRLCRLYAPQLQRLFNQGAMDRRLRQLLATGAFRSAHYEQQRDATAQQLDLTLHLQDGKARGISGYGGVETYEGTILGARFHDDNLADSLRSFNAGLEWTDRGALFDVVCRDPWLFNRDILGQLRYNAITRELDGYKKFETGLLASATWDVSEFDQLTLLLGSAQVHTNALELSLSDLGETSYNQLRARLHWLHDRRDHSTLPENGWYWEQALELGSAISFQPSAYLKHEFSCAWYRRWQDSGKLALGCRSGWLLPAIRGADLPIDIRYFLGGAQSFRGLAERQLGPRNAAAQPRGGNAYWLINAEWTEPIAAPIEAVFFLDTGNLAREHLDFDVDAIGVTLGCGLHWQLPIGPLRLEYGRNLTRQGTEPHGAFHFAIGMAF